jgi:hypothetical protein
MITLALDNTTTKTLEHYKLYITQYNNSWKQYENENINKLESREFYDIFKRPIERMVARNMPFTENLHKAFLSKVATEDFTLILTRMVGLKNKPVRFSSTLVIE